MKKKRIGDVLVSLGVITEKQLADALDAQRLAPAPLGSILIRNGVISEDKLLDVLAIEYGVESWPLATKKPELEAIAKVPESVCREYQVLPVAMRGQTLLVATSNPDDLEAIDMVRYATRLQVEPVLANRHRLIRAIEDAFTRNKASVEELMSAAVKRVDDQMPVVVEERSSDDEAQDSAPVVGLVNQILSEAIREGASDIHIEPRADRVDIRYRIDGHLRKFREVPSRIANMLTSRLKIMADLDIVEFRIPQDGRISIEVDGRPVDLRVSVLPNYHGQRIVLRVLDKAMSLRKLEDLGFAAEDLGLFRRLIDKPYGLFLVTGPTGSGKTTSLYAALNAMRSETNNVMTCEDPIEYELDGINQSQVNEKVGLTFAAQLRAILRQDPDVVLVGEIRDAETAITAVRASLTGHMVFSTLHCNDSPGAVPRLVDMGIDPFMLSTSLTGVMSQRLVRLLCKCAGTRQPTDAERRMMQVYGVACPDLIAEPKGCDVCRGAGFKGRKAVTEILPVAPAVAKLIADNQPADKIKIEGIKWGYIPMQVRVLRLVAEGRTTVAEAERMIFLDAEFGLGIDVKLPDAA